MTRQKEPSTATTEPPAPSTLLRLTASIGSIGDRPDDTDHERLQHRFLVFMGVLMSLGGSIWGTLCLGFGLWQQSLIPYGYVVLTAVNLWYFARSKNFLRVRFVQVLMSLLLPMLFQIVLGGFAESGNALIWSMLSVVGSLTFTESRTMLRWLFVYTGCVLLLGLLDGWAAAHFHITDSQVARTAFVTLNMVMVSNVVFGLTLYLLEQRERAARALQTAQDRIIGLEKEVESARKLGQYTLQTKLGEGGMGAVYRGRHAMLRRPTAVKVIRPDHVGANSLGRFEREVQHTAALTHPNTVRIYDYGRTDDGLFYYVMEYLQGFDLEALVRRDGAMPVGRVVHLLEQAVGALAEAHAQNLIHRDIKPANLMVCGDRYLPDVVKVMDFGLVKELKTDSTGSLTEVGMIAGTPHYMSPEAISSPQDVGPATDVYAIGCVAVFLLTGRELFTGATPMAICGMHLHVAPEPLSERAPDVPEPLAALVMRCIAKSAADRPSTEELHEALVAMKTEPWARWTRADARAWWTEHGSSVPIMHRETPISGGETLHRMRQDSGVVDQTTADVESPSASAIGRALRDSDIAIPQA